MRVRFISILKFLISEIPGIRTKSSLRFPIEVPVILNEVGNGRPWNRSGYFMRKCSHLMSELRHTFQVSNRFQEKNKEFGKTLFSWKCWWQSFVWILSIILLAHHLSSCYYYTFETRYTSWYTNKTFQNVFARCKMKTKNSMGNRMRSECILDAWMLIFFNCFRVNL